MPFIYHFLRGAIGSQLVIKHYRYGIVVTRFPDMTAIKASKEQRHCRQLFKEAVAYARGVNKDAVQKAAWVKQKRKGTLYHAAIREYLRVARQAVAVPNGCEATSRRKALLPNGVADCWPRDKFVCSAFFFPIIVFTSRLVRAGIQPTSGHPFRRAFYTLALAG